MILKGSFDVKVISSETFDSSEGIELGRMRLAKIFHGALEATSTVEMLSARGEIKNSAGYVALERVSAKIEGRSGSFVLQHSGTMNRGKSHLDLHVVADSGTGELKGLSGSMSIDIVEGKHFYTFDYAL